MHKTTMAFAVNETGISVPLEQASSLRVYDLQSGKWTISREWNLQEFGVTITDSIGETVRSLLACLQGCFTLVSGEFSEPVRMELERTGIDVWELRGEPTELAELIVSDEALMAA